MGQSVVSHTDSDPSEVNHNLQSSVPRCAGRGQGLGASAKSHFTVPLSTGSGLDPGASIIPQSAINSTTGNGPGAVAKSHFQVTGSIGRSQGTQDIANPFSAAQIHANRDPDSGASAHPRSAFSRPIGTNVNQPSVPRLTGRSRNKEVTANS